MKGLFWVCFMLTVIGGLNWGLIGFFQFDLVQFVFSGMPFMVKLVYCLVGISSLLVLFLKAKHCSKSQ